MTFARTYTPATGAVAMWALIEELLAAGWTKPMDADGTTYSSNGIQVTGGGSGAHGLGNALAWVRLVAPVASGNCDVVIQHHSSGANHTDWRIITNPTIPIDGGFPDKDTTPDGAGDVILLGGGAGAAPTFVPFFSGDASYLIDVMTSEDGDFALLAYLHSSTGSTDAVFVRDQRYGYDQFIGATPIYLASTPTAHFLAQLNTALLADHGGGAGPTVTAVSPTAGQVVYRQMSLHYTITSATGVFASICVMAKFPSGLWELVHDGTSFAAKYSSSVRTVIANGFDYVITRNGPWSQTPQIVFRAVDDLGNLNS